MSYQKRWLTAQAQPAVQKFVAEHGKEFLQLFPPMYRALVEGLLLTNIHSEGWYVNAMAERLSISKEQARVGRNIALKALIPFGLNLEVDLTATAHKERAMELAKFILRALMGRPVYLQKDEDGSYYSTGNPGISPYFTAPPEVVAKYVGTKVYGSAVKRLLSEMERAEQVLLEQAHTPEPAPEPVMTERKVEEEVMTTGRPITNNRVVFERELARLIAKQKPTFDGVSLSAKEREALRRKGVPDDALFVTGVTSLRTTAVGGNVWGFVNEYKVPEGTMPDPARGRILVVADETDMDKKLFRGKSHRIIYAVCGLTPLMAEVINPDGTLKGAPVEQRVEPVFEPEPTAVVRTPEPEPTAVVVPEPVPVAASDGTASDWRGVRFWTEAEVRAAVMAYERNREAEQRSLGNSIEALRTLIRNVDVYASLPDTVLVMEVDMEKLREELDAQTKALALTETDVSKDVTVVLNHLDAINRIRGIMENVPAGTEVAA